MNYQFRRGEGFEIGKVGLFHTADIVVDPRPMESATISIRKGGRIVKTETINFQSNL